MNIQGRLSHILDFAIPEGVVEAHGLPAAYCACLTPREACELFGIAAMGLSETRNIALRRVRSDMEASYEDFHDELLEELIRRFGDADAKARQSLGYSLTVLAAVVPRPHRKRIQELFLSSKYVAIRRRAYKLIELARVVSRRSVTAAWERFGDPECAWLIVKTFPVQFLLLNYKLLEANLTEGWEYSRLYLRLAEDSPELLENLRGKDEISYCYVLAKLRRALPAAEVRGIVDRNCEDERFGLLVWALGKLGLWEVLTHIESTLQLIQARRMAALRIRLRN